MRPAQARLHLDTAAIRDEGIVVFTVVLARLRTVDLRHKAHKGFPAVTALDDRDRWREQELVELASDFCFIRNGFDVPLGRIGLRFWAKRS